MTMPDLHRNPINLYIIKNVEDTVVFLLINKKCASHFRRETANKNKAPEEKEE